MAKSKSGKALADVLFPEAREQQGFAEGILSIPPELRKLHTETYDFTVDTIVDKVNDNSIFLPYYQRRYVWTDSQASRLIESLIIQCPIPVIYLNQEADERLAIIDGNQRVTSIRKFLDNEFALKGLTAYPELEGNRFYQLDSRFQRHIRNRTIRCIVILKDTHSQVKFDVFERLNTGAARLTPQELRHGLYFGDLITTASLAVNKNQLVSILKIKIDKRMKAEELVIRFWALNEQYEAYRKPMSTFLNNFADSKRNLSEEERKKYLYEFSSTLNAVLELLGDMSFKIFDHNGNVESYFNSALFDALMIGISKLLKKGKIHHIAKDEAQKKLAEAFETDESFRKSISFATSDEQQLKLRVNVICSLFGEYAEQGAV